MASLHPMALPARSRLHDPLEEFEDVLEACRRESVIHDPPRKFIIAIRLLEWFRSECEPNRTNAGRILMAIHHSYPPNFIKNLLNTMGPGEECWLKVFTILLMLKRGKDIGTFLKMGILDKRLPITEDHLLEKLQNILGRPLNEGNRQFATDFTSLQYQLLTTDSLDSENGRVLDSRIILPVCRYEPIKPDGSEKIFQIEIPCRSIPSKILKNVKAKPKRTAEDDDEKYHKFAIKTLRNPEEYHQETFAYSALKGREGVVQCLGFWEIKSPSGESDFHLLLEYGEYDLHEYFENFPPPSLPGDIIQFWKGLSHVAIALDKIHNMEIKYEQRTDSWFGYMSLPSFKLYYTHVTLGGTSTSNLRIFYFVKAAGKLQTLDLLYLFNTRMLGGMRMACR
ncbi:hypothetical protein BKA64DRAFT_21601 [Cadophora sp. MPI-SDFR-AT-0126]|nr:hypothetical protein BKA64DRAFT_21601 [Leotiomycetes sp. MPI-SDFR-AT-0126]